MSTGKTPNVAVDAKKGEVYFAQFIRKNYDPITIGCLDLATGNEKWTTTAPEVPVGQGKHAGLCAYGNDVIVIGGGDARTGGGAYAYSAADGRHLWSAEYKLVCSGRSQRHKGSSYIDGYFIDGLFWIMPGYGVGAEERGAIGWHGYDPMTGVVVKRLDMKEDELIGDSCHRTNASELFLLGGHAKFVDRRTGRLVPRSYAIHNGCHFGMLPANGLWYTSSIYLNDYILGEMGLAGKRDLKPDAPTLPGRLVKGPGMAAGPPVANTDWPVFRANDMGTGKNAAGIPAKPAQLWAERIGTRLGPPIAVAETIYVADQDELRVIAVDTKTGKSKWGYTVNGRPLAPPTYHKGTILVGCGDGVVYCLGAADGKLIWKFRAAPAHDRIIVRERLESVWPVHSGVLVEDGTALFAAGRAGSLDGGVDVYALNAATGELVWHKHDDSAPLVQWGVSDGKSYQLYAKGRFAVKDGSNSTSIKDAPHNPDVLMPTTRLGAACAAIQTQAHVRGAAMNHEHVVTVGPPMRKPVRGRAGDGIVNYPEDDPDLKESVLSIFSVTGDPLHAVTIDALPVFDGLCAAGDKLFIATQDGKLRCFGR